MRSMKKQCENTLAAGLGLEQEVAIGGFQFDAS